MATEILWKEMFMSHIANSDKVVLVDFWAERCGPCRMLKPVLHDISDKRDDVELLTVNVDAPENGELTMEYSVRSIPQVTVFSWWNAVDQFIGAIPPDQIELMINKHAWAGGNQEEEQKEEEQQQEESEEETEE